MNIDPADKMPNLAVKPDGVHPKLEKYILRKAFDTPEAPYLPDEFLFRQKEQFSDGVGYSWVDGLKSYAEKVRTGAAAVGWPAARRGPGGRLLRGPRGRRAAGRPVQGGVPTSAAQVISDDMWDARELRFPEHTPRTREYFLLRSIFESQFPHLDSLNTVPKASAATAPRPWIPSHLLGTGSLSVVGTCHPLLTRQAALAHCACRA
jgi:asparagine synthase (glutamine-hydrolysing)